jgi:hypothetical protein
MFLVLRLNIKDHPSQVVFSIYFFVLKVWKILSNFFRIYTQKRISMYPHNANIWGAGAEAKKIKQISKN